MSNTSRFDPTRKTVGAIYRDAQFSGEKQIITGDMNHEMLSSLVQDVNLAIIDVVKKLGNKPFYLAMYEKRDLQMKKAFIRIPKAWIKRPYPEQDSIVFKVFPSSNTVYFCWCLPHNSEMRNMLACVDIYPEEQLIQYRRWANMQLEYFGFIKDEHGHWTENLMYRGDTLISSNPDESTKISTHVTGKVEPEVLTS